MRVALVSPYSWTYPGGVTRHIEALAAELLRRGPRRARARARSTPTAAAPRSLHRGARPQARARAGVAGAARRHDRLAVQRRRLEPRRHAVRRLDAAPRAARRRLRRRPPARAGRARSIGWDALTSRRRAAGRHVPLLLGERCRRTRSRRCSARGASSTTWPCGSRSPRPRPGPAGASTAARYRVVPNGVVLPAGGVPAPRVRAAGRAAADRVRRPGRRAQGPAACCCAPSRRCASRCPPS